MGVVSSLKKCFYIYNFFLQVKNSCFNKKLHNWLISNKVDIDWTSLDFPPAGPGVEAFSCKKMVLFSGWGHEN